MIKILINFSLSKTNLLQIKDKTELMRRENVPTYDGSRLSIDWVHNLVYYNEDKEILVFNMTDTTYEYVVIQEEDEYMNDLTVNPLNSILFYFTNDLKNAVFKRQNYESITGWFKSNCTHTSIH